MEVKGIDNTNKLKVISWNINGLRAILKKKGLLKSYIKSESPDVIFLIETKLDTSDSEYSTLFDGYLSYFNSCTIPDKKGYSGIAAFTKEKPENISYKIGHEILDKEGRMINLEFPSFYIIGCYVPNCGSDMKRGEFRSNEWDNCLMKYMKSLEEKKPVILCGDLNMTNEDIDLYNTIEMNKKYKNKSKKGKENFHLLLEEGYIDIFRKLYPNKVQYSYWGYRHNMRESKKGWRLDYFLVSNKLIDKVCDSMIRDEIRGSDHCPIVLVLNEDRKKNVSNYVSEKRKINNKLECKSIKKLKK